MDGWMPWALTHGPLCYASGARGGRMQERGLAWLRWVGKVVGKVVV